MKEYKKAAAGVLLIIIILIIGANVYLSRLSNLEGGRTYRVEISRAVKEIRSGRLDIMDMSKYKSIKKIAVLEDSADEKERQEFFEGNDNDYLIREVGGRYYRFEYEAPHMIVSNDIKKTVNVTLAVMAFVVCVVLLYIWYKIIRPFHTIQNVPYELSKGNLTAGLKENKSRMFGKFVWGLDLLRENLEEQKENQLRLQKEKKTLVLSISHDIKTPLSVIKLYAKALSRNLYEGEEKRSEIAGHINDKADEIEGFVQEIINASSEDFLNLEVKEGEFYLAEMLARLDGYYAEKLTLLKIPFFIDDYDNCLLKGDIDRAIEVLQNMMENAIKYGDGGEIRITSKREEDCQLLTVKNSGLSLEPGEAAHIFESFWRGSNVGTNQGSGLGLYICRQLMRKMDGDTFAECQEGNMLVSAVFRRV